MSLPESMGGAGATLTDLAIVAEVAGAHLAPVPLVEHAVTAERSPEAGGHDALVAELASRRTPSAPSPFVHPSKGRPVWFRPEPIADVVLHHDDGTTSVTRNPAPGSRAQHRRPPLAHRATTDAEPVALDGDGWIGRSTNGARSPPSPTSARQARPRDRRRLRQGTDPVRRSHRHLSSRAARLRRCGHPIEGAHLLAQRAVWALDTDQSDASRLAGMALLFAAESACASQPTDPCSTTGVTASPRNTTFSSTTAMPRHGFFSWASRRRSTPGSQRRIRTDRRGRLMDFSFPPDVEAFRAEVRAFSTST